MDNCGPNGGAMVKCFVIKRFNSVLPASLSGEFIQCSVWVIPIIRNDHDHIFTIQRGDVMYNLTCTLIISDPTTTGVPPGKLRCLFKPNATANNAKYPHLPINLPAQSLCVADVLHSEVCFWWDDLSFFVRKYNMHTSGMKPELSAFTPLYFIILKICQPSWLAEWGLQLTLYITATLIWSEARAPWGYKFCSDWLMCQTKNGGMEASQAEQSCKHKQTVWPTGWRNIDCFKPR